MKLILAVILSLVTFSLKAQKVEDIFFNLYTDSLKKGTHNYINVEGKYANGRWMPLTSKDLRFSASGGNFDNNDLVIDKDFMGEKVTVTAVLKSDTAIHKNITIYIKKLENWGKVKTPEEISEELKHPPKKSKNR